jgi:hypothetical protein
MTPDTQQRKPQVWLDRARETWFRLTAPVIAWRERAEGGREEWYVADLNEAEAVRRWHAAAILKRNPLLSPETVAALGENYPHKFIRTVHLRGRENPVEIHEVLPI